MAVTPLFLSLQPSSHPLCPWLLAECFVSQFMMQVEATRREIPHTATSASQILCLLLELWWAVCDLIWGQLVHCAPCLFMYWRTPLSFYLTHHSSPSSTGSVPSAFTHAVVSLLSCTHRHILKFPFPSSHYPTSLPSFIAKCLKSIFNTLWSLPLFSFSLELTAVGLLPDHSPLKPSFARSTTSTWLSSIVTSQSSRLICHQCLLFLFYLLETFTSLGVWA